MDHIDGLLGHGIERGYSLRIRLKRPLRNDQIGKLLRDIHVRALKRSALQHPEAGAA